jgi:hypothetical protein
MQTTTSEARYSKKNYAFKQLNLFTKKIRSAYLVAWGSPRKAFYRIWIETLDGEYSVVKESGIRGRVLDRRIWPAENLEAAQKLFQRRIKAKTNPERKSPRKYTLVQND